MESTGTSTVLVALLLVTAGRLVEPARMTAVVDDSSKRGGTSETEQVEVVATDYESSRDGGMSGS